MGADWRGRGGGQGCGWEGAPRGGNPARLAARRGAGRAGAAAASPGIGPGGGGGARGGRCRYQPAPGTDPGGLQALACAPTGASVSKPFSSLQVGSARRSPARLTAAGARGRQLVFVRRIKVVSSPSTKSFLIFLLLTSVFPPNEL